MKPKLFINFGLPKTSSTNLQANFYPFLQNVNYLGRIQGAGLDNNPTLFKELNMFVEGGEQIYFNNTRLDKLKNSLIQNLKSQINLVSMENWAFPYQRNLINNKIEVVSQFEKLKRLKKFVESLDIEYSFFVIHRKPIDGIISLFVTAQNRIEKVFGPKYLEFNKFLLKYERRDVDFKSMQLLFDVYNIMKIKEVFNDNNLKIFNYDDIKENPNKFLNDFCNYLNIPIDDTLLNNITKKTGATPLKKGNYFVKTPNNFFILLKKCVPNYLKNKLSNLLFISKLKKFLLKNYVITNEDKKKLTIILNQKNFSDEN